MKKEKSAASLSSAILPLIGRRERIILSDFKDLVVEAKIDTGAYTSSLHARVLGTVRSNQQTYVRFIPLPHINSVEYVLPRYRFREVKSSTGHSDVRHSVRCLISLFGKNFRVEFNLADRTKMRFPVLLGRRFLKGRFWVDVARSHTTLL